VGTQSAKEAIMKFAFFKATFVGLLLGAIYLGTMEAKGWSHRMGSDWVEMAREAELTPCFYNIVMARLYWEAHSAQYEMTHDEKVARYGADRIITSGHHKSVVVPENCFAVTTGLYGFSITFWQRPLVDGKRDMSIPYWNPPENPI
jgi:hypothetical protein